MQAEHAVAALSLPSSEGIMCFQILRVLGDVVLTSDQTLTFALFDRCSERAASGNPATHGLLETAEVSETAEVDDPA